MPRPISSDKRLLEERLHPPPYALRRRLARPIDCGVVVVTRGNIADDFIDRVEPHICSNIAYTLPFRGELLEAPEGTMLKGRVSLAGSIVALGFELRVDTIVSGVSMSLAIVPGADPLEVRIPAGLWGAVKRLNLAVWRETVEEAAAYWFGPSVEDVTPVVARWRPGARLVERVVRVRDAYSGEEVRVRLEYPALAEELAARASSPLERVLSAASARLRAAAWRAIEEAGPPEALELEG